MFQLTLPDPLTELSLPILCERLSYHMKRSKEVFTSHAKHEHLRMADLYAGELADRTGFHDDCQKNP